MRHIKMRLVITSVISFLLITTANAEDDFDAAKAIVSEKLKDPESARFTDLSISADGKVVCGRVNAKNSFGGYVGPQRFRYYIADKRAFIVDRYGISTDFIDTMANHIPGLCP